MKKRLLASILSLAMVFSLVPVSALAAEDETTDGEMSVVCAGLEGYIEDGQNEGYPLYAVLEEPDDASDFEKQQAEPIMALMAEETQDGGHTRTTTLDLTAETIDTTKAEAEGWAWDAASKTLTLNGLNLSVSEGHGIVVPDGTTIALTAGSENRITNTASEQYGIAPQGSLTVKSADIVNRGTLEISTAASGIALFITEDQAREVKYQFQDMNLTITGTRGTTLAVNAENQQSNINPSISMKNTTYVFQAAAGVTNARALQVGTNKGDAKVDLDGSIFRSNGGLTLLSCTNTAIFDISNNSTAEVVGANCAVGNGKAATAKILLDNSSFTTSGGTIQVFNADDASFNISNSSTLAMSGGKFFIVSPDEANFEVSDSSVKTTDTDFFIGNGKAATAKICLDNSSWEHKGSIAVAGVQTGACDALFALSDNSTFTVNGGNIGVSGTNESSFEVSDSTVSASTANTNFYIGNSTAATAKMRLDNSKWNSQGCIIIAGILTPTSDALFAVSDSTVDITAPNSNDACIYVGGGAATTVKTLIDNSTVTLTQNFTGGGNKSCLQMSTKQKSADELCELIIQNNSSVICDNKMPGTYNYGISLETAGIGRMEVTDSTVSSTGYTGIGFGKSNGTSADLPASGQELIVANSTVTATGFGKTVNGGYGSGILMNSAPFRSTELTAEKSAPVKVRIKDSTVNASGSYTPKEGDSETAASGVTLLTNAADVEIINSALTADSTNADKTGVEIISAGTSHVQVSGSTISSGEGSANGSLIHVTASGENQVTTENGVVSAEKPITLDKDSKLTTEADFSLTVIAGDTTATYTPAEGQQVTVDPATGMASTAAGSALTVAVGDSAATYTPESGKTVMVDTATGTATTETDATLSVTVGEATVNHKPTAGGTVSVASDGTITLNTATGTKYSGQGNTLPAVDESGKVALPVGAVVTLPNGTTYIVTEAIIFDPSTHNEQHVWDGGVVTTAPTYSSTGIQTYTCTLCGATKTETLPALSHGSGGTSNYTVNYTVSVDSGRNGSVSVSPKNASEGDNVTVTVNPDAGYELEKLTVTDKDGKAVELTESMNGKYTFTMPASKVSVEAAFAKIADQPTITFIDVPADACYAEAVVWAVKTGITSGTSAATFSPDASCTRAQMVTFLWKAAGCPKATGSNPFSDLESGAYYYNAVLWAVEHGITGGTSATTFSPEAAVTRGQTVTFQYRAAGSPAVSGGSFADVAEDAYYADAVAWAVANGITNGTSSTTFSPDAPCTRWQIVTFLYRDMA